MDQQPQNSIMGVDINNPGPILAAAAHQQQQRIIWTGPLEWMDKVKEQTTLITRSLHCQILLNQEDTEINTSKWPEKLSMSMFPPIIVSNLRNYLKSVRTVTLLFNQNQDGEALRSLYRSLSNNFGGCIHIGNPGQQESPNDILVLMLLYSNRQHQYIAMMPLEQTKFYYAIRTAIQKHKQQQIQQQQHQVKQQPNPILGVDLNNPGPILAAAAQQQQQRIIWTGPLEWIDKVKDQTTRITRSLHCQILLNQEDTEINTSKWPEKLSMSMFPPIIVSNLRNYLKSVRTVTLLFNQNQDGEALRSLYRSLSNNFGGCIHIGNPGQQESPNGILVLMLLYSNRQHQYIAMMPLKQTKFYYAIRTAIQKHKANMGNQPAQAPDQMPSHQQLQQQQQVYQQSLDQRQQQFLAMQQQQQAGAQNFANMGDDFPSFDL